MAGTVPSERTSRATGDASLGFLFSDEREEFSRSLRRFFDDKSPEAEVRRLMETEEGYDRLVWRAMAEQLGLQGLAMPEDYGGSGYGYNELVLVFEEMGRALLCAPFFSTVALAADVLLASGDEEAKAAYLPAIARGESIATLALTEDGGRFDEAGVAARASRSGDGYVLQGHKMYVLDGHVADLVLVAARVEGAVSLFAVPGGAAGLTRTPLVTLDQTRKQARLDFAGTPAQLVGGEGEAWPAIERTLRRAAVALAAEQAGGAQRCLEMATGYANERIQFGRPIGSFQAVKHKCVDVLMAVESAKSAAYYAGWAATEDPEELPVAASLAKAYCSEAFTYAAKENVQLHGGIGVTWEHPAHLYLKRAKSSEVLLGDPAYHRELLARLTMP